jgi:hypothetical protein
VPTATPAPFSETDFQQTEFPGAVRRSNLFSRRIPHQCDRRSTMGDQEIRVALDRHWEASDAGDLAAEHDIYRADAVLEYPQSGERIRGRDGIQSSRGAQPNANRFEVRRIIGAGELWITELIMTYDGAPSYAVSIMEFTEGKVARETQYFAHPFEPGPTRIRWVEPMC